MMACGSGEAHAGKHVDVEHPLPIFVRDVEASIGNAKSPDLDPWNLKWSWRISSLWT
jgi:hypothetical protein